jgi:predicted transposase YdaD
VTEPGGKSHDALFRRVFSQPEHAAGELKLLLPTALVDRIDWSTLQTVDASAIDRDLRQLASDLLFRVEVDGDEAFIYLLIEHQSSSDPLMALRLLRFMVRLWDQWLGEHPGAPRVPAVVPMVVHHSASGWTAPVSFHELIALSPEALASVAAQLPSFTFLLDDLSTQAADQLGSRAMTALGRLALMCLARARHSPDLLAELRRYAELVEQVLDAPHGVAAFAAVVSYILQVTDTPPQDLEGFVQQMGPKAVEAYMTGAQQLTAQARAEGRAEGQVEGQAELLLKQLRLRFGALSPEVEERVRTASVEQLDVWAERVLSAASLQEVLDG